MLIGIFFALSILASAGVCGAFDAFSGLGWLWILPLCTAGIFLLLIVLWAVMMLIMAKSVDMDKEQEEDNAFFRTVIHLTIGALLILFRIRVDMEGLEKTPKDGRFMLVCNHLHDTDPVVLLWAFAKSRLAFVSKRENDQKFIIGPFLHRILCQPINRENDREALKTILKCIRLLQEDKVSIGVFPEGYCSKEHLLHPFRSGVFKIAQKANVPIVVCTVRNTHPVFKNMAKLKPSHVQLRLVGVVPAEDLKGRTAVDIAHQVYDMMAQDLGPELVLPVTQEAENT